MQRRLGGVALASAAAGGRGVGRLRVVVVLGVLITTVMLCASISVGLLLLRAVRRCLFL
jgi:hypothetical protein